MIIKKMLISNYLEDLKKTKLIYNNDKKHKYIIIAFCLFKNKKTHFF